MQSIRSVLPIREIQEPYPVFPAQFTFSAVKLPLPAVLFLSSEYVHRTVMLLSLIFYGRFFGWDVYVQALPAKPWEPLLGYRIRIMGSYGIVESFFRNELQRLMTIL